jgi:cardiolipin synthase
MDFQWLSSGAEAFDQVVPALAAAKRRVRVEMYIFRNEPIGLAVRDALVQAATGGADVAILLDSLGSMGLSEAFWEPLRAAGGKVTWFNPLKLRRLAIRDHRKIIAIDDEVAFVGGFNVATEYTGDGVTEGWRDFGLKVFGQLARELSRSVDEMISRAELKPPPFSVFRKSPAPERIRQHNAELLLTFPGRRESSLRTALLGDFQRAEHVRIISAYFLPTWRLRTELLRVSRRGGTVQLILPAKSDVPLSQLASRSMYRRLMRAGVEIYEYQPQILHGKMFICDDVVYAGSSNLDIRSLQSNYELMLRIHDPSFAQEARAIFTHDLKHCRRITLEEWKATRNFWEKLKQRWAFLILARLDPLLTRWQLRHLAKPPSR